MIRCCAVGSSPRTLRARIFPSRICPSACFDARAALKCFVARAIGECIVDLGAACERGVFDAAAREAAILAARPALNDRWRRARAAARRCAWHCHAHCAGALCSGRHSNRRCCRRRRPNRPCPLASAIIRISTARFITPLRLADCFVRSSRCCRTIAGCPWAITAAVLPLRSQVRSLCARLASACLPRPRSRRWAVASASTTSSSSASS